MSSHICIESRKQSIGRRVCLYVLLVDANAEGEIAEMNLTGSLDTFDSLRANTCEQARWRSLGHNIILREAEGLTAKRFEVNNGCRWRLKATLATRSRHHPPFYPRNSSNEAWLNGSMSRKRIMKKIFRNWRNKDKNSSVFISLYSPCLLWITLFTYCGKRYTLYLYRCEVSFPANSNNGVWFAELFRSKLICWHCDNRKIKILVVRTGAVVARPLSGPNLLELSPKFFVDLSRNRTSHTIFARSTNRLPYFTLKLTIRMTLLSDRREKFDFVYGGSSWRHL